MLKNFLVFVGLILTSHAHSQLVFQHLVNDYGTIPKARVLYSEFVLTNTGSEEAYILRLNGASNFTWSFTQLAIQPGQNDTIRLYFKPESKGRFSEKVQVFLSSDEKPIILEMKGVIGELIEIPDVPCYSFREHHEDLFTMGVIPKLEAQIIDAQTKKPISDAFFQVYDNSYRMYAGYTKTDGEIHYMVSPNMYQLRISADGYKEKRLEQYINPSTKKLVIEMTAMDVDTAVLHAAVFPKYHIDTTYTSSEKIENISSTLETVTPVTIDTVKKNIIEPEVIKPIVPIDSAHAPEYENGELSNIVFAPNNIVMLIDISGSMVRDGRMEAAIEACHTFIEKLRPIDKVSIVVFGERSEILIPPTPVADKSFFYQKINILKAGGMTNANKGVTMAYDLCNMSLIAGGNNQIVLMTDGAFRINSTEKELITKMGSRSVDPIVLSVMMLGPNLAAGEQLKELAQISNGNYTKLEGNPQANQAILDEIKNRSKRKFGK